MTPDELLACHDRLCGRAKALMETKNRDYRGGTADPFANFRGSEFLGVDPIIGIAMRMMDKLQRIRAFAATGQLVVKSESVDDAILDLINYSILMAGMAEERGPTFDPMEQPHPMRCVQHGGSPFCERYNMNFGLPCPECAANAAPVRPPCTFKNCERCAASQVATEDDLE